GFGIAVRACQSQRSSNVLVRIYSRKEYAFLFQEPNLDPIIFRRPSIGGIKALWGQPQTVFVTDGDLYLQYGTVTNVVLWPFGSGQQYKLQTTNLKGWDTLAGAFFQHIPSDGSIAFFVDDYRTSRRPPSDNLLVFL